MSGADGQEQQVRTLREQLPDYMAIRATAEEAVTSTAAEIGLDLSGNDARAIAMAVVDRIEQTARVSGIVFAYSVVVQECNGYRQGVVDLCADAAAHDREAGARLYLHQQYQQGMEAVRDRLRGTVVHVGRNWLGIRHPAFEAPPVVPLRPPAGAADARQRSALRAGVA